MNIKEIKEMIKLMNDNNLMELEIEKEGLRIKLKKGGSPESGQSPFIIERTTLQEKSIHPTPGEQKLEEKRLLAEKTIEIKAPMVGTFYRAPGPESPPYVETGQIIEPGQVICIIEAMKLMNEIKSEIKGKITEILTENAEPVEFGQSLFIVEPI